MISRRFLLGSAASVAIVPMLPPAKALGDIGGSTWGAGTEALALDYYRTGIRAGFMSIADVRRAEDLFDLDLLLGDGTDRIGGLLR